MTAGMSVITAYYILTGAWLLFLALTILDDEIGLFEPHVLMLASVKIVFMWPFYLGRFQRRFITVVLALPIAPAAALWLIIWAAS